MACTVKALPEDFGTDSADVIIGKFTSMHELA
jgi:hypothetical protein